MPGSTHDATITRLREVAHQHGVSDEVLEEVCLEAQSWLQKDRSLPVKSEFKREDETHAMSGL